MEPVTQTTLGVLLVFAGGAMFAYNAWKLRPVYHILTNDPIPVRDLVYHTGPAEIEGTAATTEDDETVRAPFSDTECLAFEYEVQEYRSSGKNSYWETLDEGAHAVSFLVEDDTGSVRVDPDGGELHVEEYAVRVPRNEAPPESIAKYINQSDAVDAQHERTFNLVVAELNVGNDQRFIERRLDVGESVYVYGDVERAPAGEWGSGIVDAILRRGPEAGVLVVSDTSERGTAWRISKGPLVWALVGLVVLVPGIVLLVASLWTLLG